VSVPGRGGADYLKTESQGNWTRTIELLPWMRFFRVTYVVNKEAPQVAYIHETWATWEAP
jgi:hypothetical protein